MSPFIMYLITRVDVILTAAEAISIIDGLAALIVTIIYVCELVDKKMESHEIQLLRKTHRLLVSVFFVSLAAVVMVPSKKDMLLIYGVPALVQSRAVQTDLPEIYRKLVEVCNDKLDSVIEDKEDTKKK